MKSLAGLLLVGNLLLALWFVLRPGAPQESAAGSLDTVGEVADLSVRPDAACLFVGPVQEERLVRDIRNIHSGWQMVTRSVPGEIRYRVYVMPVSVVAEAQESEADGLLAGVREMLQESGLDDVESYQMLNGQLAGAVSFGLFAERENAQRLLVRLIESGIEAQMTEEPRLNEQSWLAELASEVPSRALSAMENLLLTRPEMNIEQNLCEMFALRE
ncbi:hypothetical protein GCM10011403_21000 [Pseudohongiella nitratireducens]|uniref:SPOR domain-containing protein n=1 Tax=Pseudohongiella nitratireducens TaxID=1768907 RepID=A0A916QLW4_9GAMM|nr:hypothetical protein [Pseudohongiella nitratireducens]GFZ77862.1 hypothetical protein GCM10011403_21000 [Pseudohongiella nitratireducens]